MLVNAFWGAAEALPNGLNMIAAPVMFIRIA